MGIYQTAKIATTSRVLGIDLLLAQLLSLPQAAVRGAGDPVLISVTQRVTLSDRRNIIKYHFLCLNAYAGCFMRGSGISSHVELGPGR